MNVLTKTLSLNAASSGVTGLALAAGAVPLSGWLGVPTWVSLAVGLGLVLFAVDVARTARNPKRKKVLAVIVADVTWVVGAAIVIFVLPETMSAEGRWALGFVTLAVAGFAMLQAFGLRGTAAA